MKSNKYVKKALYESLRDPNQGEIDQILDRISRQGYQSTNLDNAQLDKLTGKANETNTASDEDIILWLKDSIEGVQFVDNKNCIYINSTNLGGFGILEPQKGNSGTYHMRILEDIIVVMRRTFKISQERASELIKKMMLNVHGLTVSGVTNLVRD